MESDTELLDRWRDGDIDAGQILVERYYVQIDRFFANKVSIDVSDLVQKTFKACVEARDRVKHTEKFRSYLFSIAHNVLYKYIDKKTRNRARAERDEISMQELDSGPRSLLIEKEEQRLLLEALRHISVDFQCILELYYWEDLKIAEIAEILDIPEGTAKSRLSRAREKLEQKLKQLADSPALLRSTLSNLEQWARQCRLNMERTGEQSATDDKH